MGPEEEVRQWYIQKLIHDYGYDEYGIFKEIPVLGGSNNSEFGTGRIDIAVFDKLIVPTIIVEVKAEEVSIRTPEVFRQLQRYIEMISALSRTPVPFGVLTNRKETVNFMVHINKADEAEMKPIVDIPRWHQ